jgi:hypothetical protein
MVLHTSIPAIAAFSIGLLNSKHVNLSKNSIKCLLLILIIAPYYYTLSWADWKNTYFDVIPQKANVEIKDGFGKGLKTNLLYSDIYNWIKLTADKYTSKDDLIISYVSSPMVHMIAKRRPALDNTYIDFAEDSKGYYENSVAKMKLSNRRPKLAFIFERVLILLPQSFKTGETYWPGKQFDLSNSDDPISKYIRNNMKPLDEFVISRPHDHVIRCYIDN